jgi:hypothetical protein
MTSPISRWQTLAVGTDVSVFVSSLKFKSSSDWLNRQSPLEQLFTNVSLYGEYTASDLFSFLGLTAGLRGTYFGLSNETVAEPRLEIEADLGRSTLLTLQYGIYQMSPSNLQVLQGFLSLLAMPNQPPRMLITHAGPNSHPEKSSCWGITLKKVVFTGPSATASLALDGYLKEESYLLQSERYPAVFTMLDSNSFESSQQFSGMKYGTGVEWNAAIPGYGLKIDGSCHFQRSFTIDQRNDASFPNGSDIPLAFKLLVAYETGHLRAMVTFQQYSGAPTTDRYYLVGTTLTGGKYFFPVDERLNSDRLPEYSRLDISASYTFNLSDWQIEPYVQILNLLNTPNVSHFSYYLSPVMERNVQALPEHNTLPILPFVGIRVEKEW